jgi:hypothetical protein
MSATRVPKLPVPLTSMALEPRKRPVQGRSAETVRVTLEAAASILESRGLSGFTANAVAERAGNKHWFALPVFPLQRRP